jgi:hypothetical protein
VSTVVITVVRFSQAESREIEQVRTSQHISQYMNSFFFAVLTQKIVKNIFFETKNIISFAIISNDQNMFVTLRHNTLLRTAIAHFKRKRVNFISLNREFSFKFSNINSVMRLLIMKRAENIQKNNKSRRQIVIVSNIAKKQHLNEL